MDGTMSTLRLHFIKSRNPESDNAKWRVSNVFQYTLLTQRYLGRVRISTH